VLWWGARQQPAEGGKLYFTRSAAPELNADKLLSANLDGTEVTELATGLNYTGDVVFDPQAKKLYVSSLVGRKILQLNTDGTQMKDFVTGLIDPRRTGNRSRCHARYPAAQGVSNSLAFSIGESGVFRTEW
jgi:hypothetical protein